MKNITLLSLLGLFATVFILTGCNDAIQEDLDTAQAALQAADSAEADVYVMDLYEAASDSFAVAQQEIEAKNYAHAESLLQFVTETATEAQNQVATRKEEMRIDNDDLILQAEQAVAQANELMSKLPSSTISLVSYQEDVTRASTDLASAKTAQADGEYAQAHELVQAALDKANELVTTLNTPETTPSAPQS